MPTSSSDASPPAAGRGTLHVARLAFEQLAFQSGPATLRIEQVELIDAVVTMPSPADTGGPAQAPSLRASRARLQGVHLSLADIAAARALLPTSATWRLDALSTLEGRIEAFITDAHWVLDADVTLRIENGRIDFNRVTVEHIGPDSSMGLSRQGLYVDAPNGRTYLYLLGASQVPGARFERRGPLFGARVIDRGALELRPFVEGLLAPAALGRPAHETQAQLDRTRLSGMLQLGDGLLGNERVEVTLTGRAQGRNRIALTAAVVGHEVVARLPELSASGARFHALGRSGRCGVLSGKLSVSLAGRSATLAADEINLADLAIGDPPA